MSTFQGIPLEEIKGIKICKQAEARWTEEFAEAIDPRGEKYYWMTGTFNTIEQDESTDIWALQNGYVSVVPSSHDLTNYQAIDTLKGIED